MKKLMIAAAAAAMIGGAYADICQMAPAQKTCRAYDFAASVKLVDGKIATDKASNVCAQDGKVYYRVKATRKIKGVFTDCNPCQAWVDNDQNGTLETFQGNTVESLLAGEAAGGATFYVATSAQKYKKVYNATQYNAATATDSYKFLLLNYFGGTSLAKSKYAEGLLYTEFVEMDQYNEERAYSLLCAGFGARDGRMLKNLAGNLAGAVAAATWCGIPTIVWEPCLETPYYTAINFDAAGNYVDTTPNPPNAWQGLSTVSPNYDAVSGTWSLKYNASKSKLATFDALMQKTFGKDWELFVGAAAPVFPMTLANVVLN